MNGRPGNRIAEAKSVSRETVKSQIKSILRQSGVSSRTGLARLIVRSVHPIERLRMGFNVNHRKAERELRLSFKGG